MSEAGVPVNAAARLMQMAEITHVPVCGSHFAAVCELIPAQRVESFGNVVRRGKSKSVGVFSITVQGRG